MEADQEGRQLYGWYTDFLATMSPDARSLFEFKFMRFTDWISSGCLSGEWHKVRDDLKFVAELIARDRTLSHMRQAAALVLAEESLRDDPSMNLVRRAFSTLENPRKPKRMIG